MTELEQINEKLDKILALLQPKKEVKTSNSLDEVRKKAMEQMPQIQDFKIDNGQFVDGWDYINNRSGSLGFYDRKAYLKALQEWEETNQ